MDEVQSLESAPNKIEEEQEVSGIEAKGGEIEGSDDWDPAEPIEQQADSVDGLAGRLYKEDRPKANTLAAADDDEYSMKHVRRGDCLIFAHSKYDPKTKVPARESAQYDTQLCKRAFTKLGFEVKTHMDLKTKKFQDTLEAERNRDRKDCDALVVVFMSHGDYKDGKEILHTYDSHVVTSALWEPFVGDKCISLAGKPKLFFIQACRGTKTDHGVGLKVSKDNIFSKKTKEYVIPAHADLLVMWASYEGMFAFKSSRLGINGSVFIHFLAEVLEKEGHQEPLHDLLIKVTRRVALGFESQCPNSSLDHNKQVPHTSSTLMRRLLFNELKHPLKMRITHYDLTTKNPWNLALKWLPEYPLYGSVIA